MSTEMTKCESCGSEMPANAQFCPTCGKANAAYTPPAASLDVDTPQGGAPTANIEASSNYGQYSAPAYQPAWEPGKYSAGSAPNEGQSGAPPPSEPPPAAQPSQGQAQYAPPPQVQYGTPTQAAPQYGSQPPPVQPYSNYPAPPINYVYQPQVGV